MGDMADAMLGGVFSFDGEYIGQNVHVKHKTYKAFHHFNWFFESVKVGKGRKNIVLAYITEHGLICKEDYHEACECIWKLKQFNKFKNWWYANNLDKIPKQELVERRQYRIRQELKKLKKSMSDQKAFQQINKVYGSGWREAYIDPVSGKENHDFSTWNLEELRK